ncbi:MAG: hypothetical protein ACOCRX_07540 [Candidatus Woesearchaeota archaeon]
MATEMNGNFFKLGVKYFLQRSDSIFDIGDKVRVKDWEHRRYKIINIYKDKKDNKIYELLDLDDLLTDLEYEDDIFEKRR